mgnify:CR=1 FL=1
MKRDDIKNILGEGATEEQITNLLNAFHNSNKEEKNTIDELQSKINSMSDYNDLKNQLDEINKAKMTEQEKLDADKKLTAQKLKEANIICNTAKVREVLAGENISDDLIRNLVSDDEGTSLANARALKQTLVDLKESVAKQTKETLVNADLKPSISNVNPNEDAMTLDKFSNMSADEQNKWLQENPNGLENLN